MEKELVDTRLVIVLFERWQNLLKWHDDDDEDKNMASIMDSVARATANQGLASFCLSQLPRTVRDKFECITETDAYFLAPIAMFKRKGTNEVYECTLVETESAEPCLANMKIKVPEDFVAKLCVIV